MTMPGRIKDTAAEIPSWRRDARIFGACLCCGVLFLAAPLWAAEQGGVKGDASVQPLPAPAVSTLLEDEIRDMKEQIAKSPDDSILHVRLGYLLLGKGAVDDAKTSFDAALKLNPRSHAAMTGEGVVLARKGNLKEAEQTLKEALVQNPNPVRTHYELGLVYQKSGDLEKAVAEYKEGIKKHEQGRK